MSIRQIEILNKIANNDQPYIKSKIYGYAEYLKFYYGKQDVTTQIRSLRKRKYIKGYNPIVLTEIGISFYEEYKKHICSTMCGV